MAQIRTLKLNLLADVTKFGAGMVEARGDINKLSTVATRAGQAVQAAFTGMAIAAGYAAVRIGTDSVKAAMEDEASQKTLAKALQNTVKATDEQIASTEKWITQQQFATGFSDSQLRPALAKLTGVTKNLAEAQDLTNLAMNISRGTGKDLESVSLALAKAHEGNLGALTRLGVPLDENTKKTGDFTAATKALSDMFGGQASTYAETYQGRLDIVNQRLGELKEGLGASLMERLSGLLKTINDVSKGFAGESGSLASSMSAVSREGLYTSSGENLGTSIKKLADAFSNLFAALSGDSATTGNDNLQTMANALEKVASGINAVANATAKLSNSNFGKAVGQFFSDMYKYSPLGGGQRAAGGSVSAGQAYRVGEFGSEMFVPAGVNGSIRKDTGGGTVINISGAIDPEGVRRQLERLFQDSGRRTAAVNLAGAAF